MYPRKSGVALVITLVVIVMLTITAVAFMTSVGLERRTSQAYLNKSKAAAAADAGIESAIATLKKAIQTNPYHAIGFAKMLSNVDGEKTIKNEFTGKTGEQLIPVVFGSPSYAIDLTQAATLPTYTPLVSMDATATPYDKTPANKVPTFKNGTADLLKTNSVNFNIAKSSDDKSGWIGSPLQVGIDGKLILDGIKGKRGVPDPNDASNLIPQPTRAFWNYITMSPDKAHQPDPSQANYNPYVARFAYWVEDETMKLDVSMVGNNANGGGFRRTPIGDMPIFGNVPPITSAPDTAYAALPLTSRYIDFGGLPLLNQLPLKNDAPGKDLNDKAMGERVAVTAAGFPLDRELAGRFVPSPTEAQMEDIKFHATPFSLSNEMTGNGRRRVNLNYLVTDGNDAATITGDLDDIYFAITGKHPTDSAKENALFGTPSSNIFQGVPDLAANEQPFPLFGSRFYPSQWAAKLDTDLNLSNSAQKDYSDHRKAYILRIAANIRDYIDSDSFPTFVIKDPSGAGAPRVQVGIKDFPDPASNSAAKMENVIAWDNPDEPVALGKEAIPYLQEHAWRPLFNSLTELGGSPANRKQVQFTVHHYFEFYNPTTKDFTAPAGTWIRLADLPIVQAGSSFPEQQLYDFYLDLTGKVFPASKVTIVTTAPASIPNHPEPSGLIKGSPTIHRLSATKVYTSDPANVLDYSMVGNYAISSSSANERFGVRIRGRNSAETDYMTDYVFACPQGVFETSPCLSLPGGNQVPLEFTYKSSTNKGSWAISTQEGKDLWNLYITGPRGSNDNTSLSIPSGSPSMFRKFVANETRTMDARSLSEALVIHYGSNSAYRADQSRWFQNTSANGVPPGTLPNLISGDGSLGQAKNTYFDPGYWPDYGLIFDDTSATAPAIIRDARMESIGELAHIYDPHRKPDMDTSGNNGSGENPKVLSARGGGRSLRLGQWDNVAFSDPVLFPAAIYDRFATPSPATPTSAADMAAWTVGWQGASWHLADVFAATDKTQPFAPASARGKLNINGVLRDGGIALRAALRQMTFPAIPTTSSETITDSAIANKLLQDDAEIAALIVSIRDYLTINGPMLERGELSQISYFNPASAANKIAGQPFNTLLDRGREELCRQLIEIITTRSLSFTIYAVGEAVREDKSSPATGDPIVTVVSQDRRVEIIALEPDLPNPYDQYQKASVMRVHKLFKNEN